MVLIIVHLILIVHLTIIVHLIIVVHLIIIVHLIIVVQLIFIVSPIIISDSSFNIYLTKAASIKGGKLCCKIFIMDMVAFMQGGIGQIVSVNIS